MSVEFLRVLKKNNPLQICIRSEKFRKILLLVVGLRAQFRLLFVYVVNQSQCDFQLRIVNIAFLSRLKSHHIAT